MVACTMQVKPIVELLLARGADPEIQGDQSYRALHFAAQQDDMEICKLLIANGVDVNAKAEGDASVLAFAAQNENEELFNFFQASGAQ